MKNKNLIDSFRGKKTDVVPVWLMRQAGRYLPEYMRLRKEAGSFLKLAYDPEKAAEITIQPIRRFEMDGAILFSDILVIPQALGQDLRFETGEGPKLGKLDIDNLDIDNIDNILNPVYETIKNIKLKFGEESNNETALIGFAGAPWTVACYMVEGKGSRDFANVKYFAYKNPDKFKKLIEIITASTIHYLKKQIEAGAEAVKIFDSWAGLCDEFLFNEFVINPAIEIFKSIKSEYPDIPVIGFPRGAGTNMVNYVEKTNVDVLAIDQSVSLKWAKKNLADKVVLQGNMDPALLLAGGEVMKKSIVNILDNFSDYPFIFNLGHGIIKETNPENVKKLVDIVHSYGRK